MIYDRWAHLHARNLVYCLNADVKEQLSLRPLAILHWVPGSSYADSLHPVDWELLRELMQIMLDLVPAEKVRYLHWMQVQYLLQELPPKTQRDLVAVLKEYYVHPRP